jgi:uncharacterized protein
MIFRHHRLAVHIAGAAMLIGVLGACASYSDKTKEMGEAYSAGQYDRALASLKESGVMENSQDRLLWRLEAATILDRKGEVEKSRTFWFEADKIADELYTLSISKTAASLIMSDASSDYDGEDFEKVAIHSMLAHQYIGLGKLDEARIEARKINTKLTEINQKYEEKSKNKYSDDAHARYLTGLIYEARGEWDNAIIDYTKGLELYEGEFSRFVKGAAAPNGLVLGLYRCLSVRNRTDRIKSLMEKYKRVIGSQSTAAAAQSSQQDGEIVVIHELGKIAGKTAKDFVLPIGNQIVRFSFPILTPRMIQDSGTGVEIQGNGFVRAENTAYLDAIASETLEDRRGRMVLKQMTRLVAKAVLTSQVEQKFGGLAGLAANVATAATETADTRSWTTLPQAFYITRARVSAGDHEFVIKTNGRVSQAKHVSVKKGQILMFRSFD